MTTQDQNKKTLRHFQCRDYLWEVFEQMSTELECSTDYLINEAMRQYARSRNYGTATANTTSTAPNLQDDAHSFAARSGAGSGANGIPSLQDSMARRTGAPAAPSSPSLPRAPTGPTLSGSPQSSPNIAGTIPAPTTQRRPPQMSGAPSMPPRPILLRCPQRQRTRLLSSCRRSLRRRPGRSSSSSSSTGKRSPFRRKSS
jgi:neural Wiskott-Aldrich syndrome protein